MITTRIRSRKNKSGTKSYLVDYTNPVTQKRERKFFPTKYEAEAHAEKLQQKNAQMGEMAHMLDPKQILEVVSILERLKPFNVKLTDAVEYYVRHAQPRQGKITFAILADEVISSKERAECKPRYIKALRISYDRFKSSFGDNFVNEISAKQIETWLDSQKYKGITRKNYIRDLKIAFEVAVKNGHCAENVVKNLQLPQIVESNIGILTPDEAKRLLIAAHYEDGRVTRKGNIVSMVPYIAIGLFAGLRSSELELLDWSEIKLGCGRIEVKAEKAKTSRRRFVEISDNLNAWLRPHLKLTGPIVGIGWRQHLQKIAENAGLKKWPKNALRHSFGSYHLAARQNANETALQMGHETTKMLFSNYRTPVTKEDAETFWKIFPPEKGQWFFTEQGNMLSMPKSTKQKYKLNFPVFKEAERAA